MRGVFDVAASGVLSGFGDRLANRGLHFVGIGLRQDAVEIQVQGWLVNTIKILQVSEGDQPVVPESVSLILGELCRSVSGCEQHECAGRDYQPLRSERKVRCLSRLKVKADHTFAPFSVSTLSHKFDEVSAVGLLMLVVLYQFPSICSMQ